MNTLFEIKVTKTEVRKRIILTEKDLRKLIRAATGDAIPIEAEIFVNVPGGGDWSNTSLGISDAPIIIDWTEVSKEQS